MYPPCPRNCPKIFVGEAIIDRQDLMIANYYQRKFTIIQSNFGGFQHYKDIILEIRRKKILF